MVDAAAVTGGSEYEWKYRRTATRPSCSIGDLLLQEPGNMVGPTNQGIDDLIARDPNALLGIGQPGGHQQHPSPRVDDHPGV